MAAVSQTEVLRAHQALLDRNTVCERFFSAEALRLAETCREMSRRFQDGGRLLAFGRGPYATDAQHVSVEFVHPVIVGKRALPGWISRSGSNPASPRCSTRETSSWVSAPPKATQRSREQWLSRTRGAPSPWPFLEAVARTTAHPPHPIPSSTRKPSRCCTTSCGKRIHVFLERRGLGQDAGDAAFLYPFLGNQQADSADLIHEVAASIRMKVADDTALRTRVAGEQSDAIAATAIAMRQRLDHGGKLILFGNGGSATDANDWAIDCVMPPAGFRPIPAISLSTEPANITAIANDLGPDLIFLRQLIAHAQPQDIAVGISTSGGSKNIVAALGEARKRGLLTVGLLGYDGGEIVRKSLVDHALVVPSDYIPRIQEVQASIYHVVRELLA